MPYHDFICRKCGKFEAEGDTKKCPHCGGDVIKIFIHAPRIGKYTGTEKFVRHAAEQQGYSNLGNNPSTYNKNKFKRKDLVLAEERIKKQNEETKRLTANLSAKEKEFVNSKYPIDSPNPLAPTWKSVKTIVPAGKGYASIDKAWIDGKPNDAPEKTLRSISI